MNQSIFIRRFFVVLVLFASLAGCASSRKQESTGEYIDDSVLTTKVKGEIFNDPELKVLQINVESYKGVVQLSGFVNSTRASAKAARLAQSVKGVKGVKNSIIVK